MSQPASPIDVMRRLRQTWLTTTLADLELAPSADFPDAHGVLVEFHAGSVLCTIAAFADGGANFITTTHFGVIGGPLNAEVQTAARRLLLAVQSFAREANPADECPYPEKGRIRFYLIADSGVGYLDAEQLPPELTTDRFAPLYRLANELLDKLRQRFADR